MDGVKPMKQLILVIMLATALGGCYVGVRSPIYGGTTEPPVVVPPPNAPVAAPVHIDSHLRVISSIVSGTVLTLFPRVS